MLGASVFLLFTILRSTEISLSTVDEISSSRGRKMYKKCSIRLCSSLSLSLSLHLSPPQSASVLRGWILPEYRGHAR